LLTLSPERIFAVKSAGYANSEPLAAFKVIVGEMPVVRRVAKPLWSSLLGRYWPEAERLLNRLGSVV